MKNFSINGVDYTSYFTSAGYDVQYTEISGRNEFTALDGTFNKDVLAVKAVVTIPLMPLTEAQVNSLLANIYSDIYATVYYYDPRINGYRSAVMTYETVQVKYRGAGGDSNDYWTGQALVFTDKFDMRKQ